MEKSSGIMVHCSSDSSRRRRLSEEAIKSESSEMRGVVILVVCGLYAASLFLVAKLLSSLLTSLSLSVRSLFFNAEMHQVQMAVKHTQPAQQTYPLRQAQPRPVCHG